MKKFLNRYVLKIDNGNEFILYNTYNESVISLNKQYISGNQIINLDKSSLNYLSDNDFFVRNYILLKKLIKERKKNTKTLNIILSITQSCNLRCSYCSQNNAKDNMVISFEVLDNTIEYIKNRVKKQKYEFLSICFFGGEPLLAKDKILYFKEKVENIFCTENIIYSIITNGTLLDNEFLSHFEKISVKVTLSEKDSHDKYRIFNNLMGSYDLIVKNLHNIEEYFLQHTGSKLVIRYNVDNEINDFYKFLNFIKQNFKFINYIELSPVYNFSFNKSINNLTKKSYTKFYIKALKNLLENKFLVEFPVSYSSPCQAYSKDGIKIFPDGKVNLCNGCDCNNRASNIKLLINNTTKQRLFKNEFSKQITNKCKKCKYIFVCGGYQICKPNQCDFLPYSLSVFLKFYVKILEKHPEYYNLFLTSENGDD